MPVKKSTIDDTFFKMLQISKIDTRGGKGLSILAELVDTVEKFNDPITSQELETLKPFVNAFLNAASTPKQKEEINELVEKLNELDKIVIPAETKRMQSFLFSIALSAVIDPEPPFVINVPDPANRKRPHRMKALYKSLKEIGATNFNRNLENNSIAFVLPPGISWDDQVLKSRFQALYQEMTSGITEGLEAQNQPLIKLSKAQQDAIRPKIIATTTKVLLEQNKGEYQQKKKIVERLMDIKPLLIASMTPVESQFTRWVESDPHVKKNVVDFQKKLIKLFEEGPQSVGILQESPIIPFMMAIRTLSKENTAPHLLNLMSGFGPEGTEDLFENVYHLYADNIDMLEELSAKFEEYNKVSNENTDTKKFS